jgi:TatD DNase family protein
MVGGRKMVARVADAGSGVRSGVIDTHCHLTFPDFAGKVDQVLREAGAAGVSGAITISTTTYDCLEALAIAKSHANVWCTAGVHPLYSDVNDPRPPTQGRMAGRGHCWENLRMVARDARCVAWGELGLDKHYSTPGLDVQLRVLEEQLAFIEGCHRETGRVLPVVVHCREAFGELIPILKRTNLAAERFVFHCFTGGPGEMRALLDFGAWVSFTGVVTYPSAPETREAAKLAPGDRIMVETDAPFLSPVPHRGKRPCVPAWVVETARALAGLRGEEFGAFAARVNENTRKFFGVE